MSPIDQAIGRTEDFLARLDHRAARASMRVTVADSRLWRERWLSALGLVAQRRESALHLLNGLRAIRHRPELTDRPGRMLKVPLRTKGRTRTA